MQHPFTKSSFFNALAVAGLVVAAHRLLTGLPDRQPRPPARAQVTFTPVHFDPADFAPLRLAGAWRVTSPEPRMGGVSALALDRGGLLALTDSGVVIRFSLKQRIASFRDLPAGPGGKAFKSGNDSESLARDSSGRGWWVGFEIRHSAYLFDPAFTHVLQRLGLGRLGWRPNKGAEGILSTPRGLLLFPEKGDVLETTSPSGFSRRSLSNRFGRLADATMLPDGRIVVLARSFSPAGFHASLLQLDNGLALRPLARLALGRLDDPEAIAAEALPGGGARIWVMTDNDHRQRVPTLLVALDWRR